MNALPTTVVVSLCLLACSAPSSQGESGAPVEQEAAVGRGLLQVSAAAPAGAVTWQRPQWQVGDRFTMVRGEHMRGTFVVQAIEAGAYVVDMGNERLVRRDQDLGNLGEWSATTGEPQRVMSPVDVRYHWPLWVGKRWQCEFVDRTRDGLAVTMHASYEVEDLDHVEVLAGAFDALRIRRTLRLVDVAHLESAARPAGGSDRFLTRTQMIWFAPEAGMEVRQLLGDTLIELAEFSRHE